MKYVYRLVVITSVFILMGAIPTQADALEVGDLVKGPNSDAVYYIGEGTKHVFPDSKTFNTWYFDFNTVTEVPVSELDGYATGAPVGYRAGTMLITHPNTNRVYAVTRGNVLHWIKDEATAASLYGSDWKARVQDVHELTFGNYTFGDDAEAGQYLEGTYFRERNGSTVYYYDGATLRAFSNSQIANLHNVRDEFVVKVDTLPAIAKGTVIFGFWSCLALGNSPDTKSCREHERGVLASDDHVRGSNSAPVAIVVYSDFECPFCLRFTDTLDEIRGLYPSQVKIAYRHFPLRSIHPMAQKAAEASECAANQNKFWEMHDEIFELNRAGTLSIDNLKSAAGALGLNQEGFDNCLDSNTMSSAVQDDYNQGLVDGVSGTPGSFINGEYVAGALPISYIQPIIDGYLD